MLPVISPFRSGCELKALNLEWRQINLEALNMIMFIDGTRLQCGAELSQETGAGPRQKGWG